MHTFILIGALVNIVFHQTPFQSHACWSRYHFCSSVQLGPFRFTCKLSSCLQDVSLVLLSSLSFKLIVEFLHLWMLIYWEFFHYSCIFVDFLPYIYVLTRIFQPLGTHCTARGCIHTIVPPLWTIAGWQYSGLMPTALEILATALTNSSNYVHVANLSFLLVHHPYNHLIYIYVFNFVICICNWFRFYISVLMQ